LSQILIPYFGDFFCLKFTNLKKGGENIMSYNNETDKKRYYDVNGKLILTSTELLDRAMPLSSSNGSKVEPKASFLTISGVKARGRVVFTEEEKARIQAEAAGKLFRR